MSDSPNAALDRWVNDIHQGDAFDVLAELPDESVHAVVTDPPYGIAFMSRGWDDFEPKEYQEWCAEWAREAKRVLKPGGHLLAFSGNRTHHRLFSGVEDAGFEIRDTVTWHYGTGFPKALDVSKAIDKQAGAEREVTGVDHGKDLAMQSGNYGGSAGEENNTGPLERRDEPATDAAEKWDGFKTALKPATEFVVVARKPLGKDTVAENVLEHGTGALNIGGTRIDGMRAVFEGKSGASKGVYNDGVNGSEQVGYEEGRYPANVVFGEQAADELDRRVGDLGVSKGYRGQTAPNGKYGEFGPGESGKEVGKGDSGGPSRYFYTSKATRAERTLDGKIENAHPTVKPPDLMEWLVKLVTAEGQTVLDPFAGTGTTCKAAKGLGREFIGIEQQAKWADVARVRCGLDAEDPSHVRDDDAQAGLEAFLAADGGQADG